MLDAGRFDARLGFIYAWLDLSGIPGAPSASDDIQLNEGDGAFNFFEAALYHEVEQNQGLVVGGEPRRIEESGHWNGAGIQTRERLTA